MEWGYSEVYQHFVLILVSTFLIREIKFYVFQILDSLVCYVIQYLYEEMPYLLINIDEVLEDIQNETNMVHPANSNTTGAMAKVTSNPFSKSRLNIKLCTICSPVDD